MDETTTRRIDPAVAIVVAAWVLLVAVRPFSTIAIDWPSFLPVVGISAVVGAVWFVYTRVRPDARLAATARAALLILLFSLGTALLNYHGFELGRPLVDETLAAVDRALGFDWWGWVVVVKSNAVLAAITKIAYLSSLAQVVGVVLILGLLGRFRRLDRFVVAFMVGALISVAVWSLFPSFGALPLAYGRGMADAPYDLAMDPAYAKQLLAHHAGAIPTLRFDRLVGLIGCPSFHTVMALLTIRALADIRGVGSAAFVVNALVIATVPVDGGHHLVDAIAGAVVAAVATVIARQLVPGRDAVRAPSAMPEPAE